MGTVADKLQAVLNSKNAIKEKFGLPDDMPFSQYAENIQAGGGGGEEINFYRCEDFQPGTEVLAVYHSMWDIPWPNKFDSAWPENNTSFDGAVGDGEGEVQAEVRFPYYAEIKVNLNGYTINPDGGASIDMPLKLVYDPESRPMGYYWQMWASRAGGDTWEDGRIEFKDGKWWITSKGAYNVYTEAPMPFNKDGSSVEWRTATEVLTGTCTASKLVPGFWNYDAFTTFRDDGEIEVDYKRKATMDRRDFWRYGSAYYGIEYIAPPYIGYAETETGEKYTTLITEGVIGNGPCWHYYEMPTTSRKEQLVYWEIPRTKWHDGNEYLDLTANINRVYTVMFCYRGAYRPAVVEETLPELIVVESITPAVNGIYQRYYNSDYPNAYYKRAVGDGGDSLYFVKGSYVTADDVKQYWVISGVPNGTNPIFQQIGEAVSVLSDYSCYVTWSPSVTGIIKSNQITTDAIVRAAVAGECAYSSGSSGLWSGKKYTQNDDGSYNCSDVLTSALPQEGFIPVPGNIYSENTKIQVEQLFGDDDGKFFLCGYVNRTYLSYNTIIVSGMPETPWIGATYYDNTWVSGDIPEDIASRNPNGTYVLSNPDASYVSSYVWICAETGCVIKQDSMGMGGFMILPSADYMSTSKSISERMDMYPSGDHYPAPSDYTSYVWQYYNGSSTTVLENGSVAVPIPDAVEPYWEGYKLYQVANGKWAISNELRKFAYSDYMPVAGRIYDSACTMEINNLDFTEDMKYSCPHNMLSDENDEWKLSVSDNVSVYNSNLLWYGFDNVRDTYFNASFSGESYLQWQNKLHPVLVKEIYVNPGGGSYGGYWGLQGSNDGEHWTTIVDIATDKWQWKNDGSWDTGDTKYKLTVPVNSAPYYYHRLIQKNRNWNIHYMEAFGFAVRQVPVFEGE